MALTQKDLQSISELLDQKLDQKLQNLVTNEQLDQKLEALRNDFYNKVDPFLKEIPESRDHRDIMDQKIYNHDDRLKKLEKLHRAELKLAL